MGMIAAFQIISPETIEQLLENPSELNKFLFEYVDVSNYYDLDKSWHAIHFMLNGSIQTVSTIAGELIVEGELLSEEDMGHGPARYFDLDKMIEISAELEKITIKSFIANVDATLEQGSKIYPGFENTDEDKEYIISYFAGMKVFCKKAIQEKKCLISYMV